MISIAPFRLTLPLCLAVISACSKPHDARSTRPPLDPTATSTLPSATVAPNPTITRTDRWPPAGQQQIAIWPGRAPDMAGISQPPESSEVTTGTDLVAGRPYTFITNVASPTMTIIRPTGANARTAIVVFPGGGFEGLAIDLEGTEVCDWITAKGITCVVLKYRVPNSNDHYDSKCKCHVTPTILRSLQDAQRTIKLVRAQAPSLGVDPHKIGVIGFSAGGYLVAQTSNIFASAYAPVDTIDQVSSRPDFALAIYPGHIWRSPGFHMDPNLHVTKQTPPTFLVQAWDDDVDGVNQTLVYAHALEEAGVSTEVHIFAKGGHAFGLRPTARPITRWPALADAWLGEIGVVARHP